jgi:Kef-type K+ transport system membrane component KefB
VHFTTLTLLLGQIAAILLASRALGVVARVFGQPLVIAEMVAGILLGPSLFGLLWPQGFHTLFPATSMPVLQMLSQLGLVLFMFMVGLELDTSLLRNQKRASVMISHASIVVPFLLGVGMAYLLRDSYKAPSVAFLPFALFCGCSLSVTAFPVLARILSERELMHTRVGAIAIACAAVDDVTAWCLLATVVAIAHANAMTEALWTLLLSAAFIGFMLLVARPLLRRLSARLENPASPSRGAVVGTLFLLVLSAGITELIGIHALFGAFLFGTCLPKESGFAKAMAEKLESVAVLLLMPLFFAYSGLRTQIGLLSGAGHWLVALGFIAIATLGKFGGSTLAARFTGLRWREASAIGVLMNTRGLMELIVLNVGMDLGVITPTVFTMLVIMALVTTIATTPILRWVYPDRLRAVSQHGATATST